MKLVLRMTGLLFYSLFAVQGSLFAMEKVVLKDPAQFFAGKDPKAKNIKDIWTVVLDYLPHYDSAARFLARYRPISDEKARAIVDDIDLKIMVLSSSPCTVETWLEKMRQLLGEDRFFLLASAEFDWQTIDLLREIGSRKLSQQEYLKAMHGSGKSSGDCCRWLVGFLNKLNWEKSRSVFIPYKRGMGGISYLKLVALMQTKIEAVKTFRLDMQKEIESTYMANAASKRAFFRDYFKSHVEDSLSELRCPGELAKYLSEDYCVTKIGYGADGSVVPQDEISRKTLAGKLENLVHFNGPMLKSLSGFFLKLQLLIEDCNDSIYQRTHGRRLIALKAKERLNLHAAGAQGAVIIVAWYMGSLELFVLSNFVLGVWYLNRLLGTKIEAIDGDGDRHVALASVVEDNNFLRWTCVDFIYLASWLDKKIYEQKTR